MPPTTPTSAIQDALEGYVDCVLAADPDSDTADEYAGVLEGRIASEPSANDEQFQWTLGELNDRR